MADKWMTVGQVLIKKDKSSTYGSFTKAGIMALYNAVKDLPPDAKNIMVQIKDPRKEVQEGVAAGRIDEDKAEFILSKIPDFVKFNLVLPPAQRNK